MVFKKIIFQNSLMANETPSRPPPFMANAILNFHFDYLNTSLTKFTKWIKSQEKINILFKMRTQNDETKWSISATKITSTFFLSLRILSASCLALSNWLFLLERTLWWLRRWIIALKNQQGHECFCWIMTFIWNKMMILFVYHLKVLLFFFLTERKAFFGGTGDEVGWNNKR